MPVPMQRPNTSLLSPMETMGDHANDIARAHREEAELAARHDPGPRPGVAARLLAKVRDLVGRLRRR